MLPFPWGSPAALPNALPPLQLDSVGSVIVMNLIFACFDLAVRLEDRASDGLALKLLYGERGRDALTATRVGGWAAGWSRGQASNGAPVHLADAGCYRCKLQAGVGGWSVGKEQHMPTASNLVHGSAGRQLGSAHTISSAQPVLRPTALPCTHVATPGPPFRPFTTP